MDDSDMSELLFVLPEIDPVAIDPLDSSSWLYR